MYAGQFRTKVKLVATSMIQPLQQLIICISMSVLRNSNSTQIVTTKLNKVYQMIFFATLPSNSEVKTIKNHTAVFFLEIWKVRHIRIIPPFTLLESYFCLPDKLELGTELNNSSKILSYLDRTWISRSRGRSIACLISLFCCCCLLNAQIFSTKI